MQLYKFLKSPKVRNIFTINEKHIFAGLVIEINCFKTGLI